MNRDEQTARTITADTDAGDKMNLNRTAGTDSPGINNSAAVIDNEHPALRRCWHPVARSADVGENTPVAVELLGEHWCVVRLGGTLAGLRDSCPHRYSPLTAGTVVDNTLRCAYHGYRFTADGTCVEIPAVDPGLPIPARACATAAAGVAEALDLIWLAPEDPIAPLPEVPEHHDPSFVNCPLPPLDWHAGAAQMTDNFLDLGHLPFVHLDTFGDKDDKIVPDYSLRRNGWQFTSSHRQVTKPLAELTNPDSGCRAVERELLVVYTAPHHVYLRINYPQENAVLTISFCHQPVNASTTRLYCTDYRNDIPDDPDAIAEAVAAQLAVAAEDKALLERIHTKSVPLIANTEYHSKADRVTLEMRRMLADLVAEVTGQRP